MLIYLELFWAFVQIGLFSFGGGYAALPLIQDQIVVRHAWLDLSEFADVVTLSQMTPGPIALNAASFVGMRIAGPGGAVAATIGCILPSFVILLILAKVYLKYREMSVLRGVLTLLRPAAVGLIASAALSIVLLAFLGEGASFSLLSVDPVAVGLFAVSLAVILKWKISPVPVMLGAGAVGTIIYLLI